MKINGTALLVLPHENLFKSRFSSDNTSCEKVQHEQGYIRDVTIRITVRITVRYEILTRYSRNKFKRSQNSNRSERLKRTSV